MRVSRIYPAWVPLLIGCASSTVSAQMPATKVVAVEAKMMEVAATVTLVGTVNAVRRTTVGSEIAGIVAEMPVRQGDRVAAGQVLCHLDNTALAFRLEEAKARLGALKARHDELVNGTRPEDLRRLKAVYEEAEADHDRWKFETERVEKLFGGQASNQKEVNDARMLYAGALNRKLAAAANLELAVNGPRKEVIAQAAFDVAEQQAVVDRTAADLKKTVIRAPFEGDVTTLSTEVGQWIPAGGPVVEMIDLSTMLVRVDAPESAMAFLVEGAMAYVKVDALKKSFEGKVRHVIRQADERARTFPVQVEVNNTERMLASGMFARVTVPSGPKSTVVAVPKEAIVETEGVPHVGIVMPGGQGGFSGVLTPVTLGAEVDEWIAASSTSLRAGSQVVTRGNERLMRFPMPVQLVDQHGNPIAAEPSAPAATKGGS